MADFDQFQRNLPPYGSHLLSQPYLSHPSLAEFLHHRRRALEAGGYVNDQHNEGPR